MPYAAEFLALVAQPPPRVREERQRLTARAAELAAALETPAVPG